MTAPLENLDRGSWREWQACPLPPWCANGPTLFGIRSSTLADDFEQLDVAVCSVCFDGTASTHIGARDGPASIRTASRSFSSQASSRGPVDLTNMRTGARGRPRSRAMADFGDLHVFPTDPDLQVRATAAEILEIAHRGRLVVMLGGEHTISFPAFAAVAKAEQDHQVGYVQIDHHFDFGDTSVLHGKYYHGSNARRISEIPGMAASRIGFVGQGDITGTEQLARLLEDGCTVRHRRDIHKLGYATALRQTLDAVCRHATAGVYVSIDIDVCDGSVAPGTGHVTMGGISVDDFLMTAMILQEYPVRAIDLVEVNPGRDGSGRTSTIAARLLYEYLLIDWQP